MIKVTKDTEKEDTQNSMIKAWDTEQPGRSQKVSNVYACTCTLILDPLSPY